MAAEPDWVARVSAEAECLFTRNQVEAALDRMSEEITSDMRNANPLVLCVMKGGVVVCGCLLPRLDFPLQLDFVQASRYGDDTRGGTLAWRVRPEHSLQGRVVLVVDDVLDEGFTLRAIMRDCETAGAALVLSAVLVDKRHARKCDPDMKADYTGLEAPDRFLFGYGLDYQGYLRNAPGLFALPEAASAP